MALEKVYDELIESEDITMEKILNLLLKSDDNLPLKSHVDNPVALSTLKLLAFYLEKKKMKYSANILNIFIKSLLEYMVSYKRMGRKEIIEAFKHKKEELERQEQINKILGIKWKKWGKEEGKEEEKQEIRSRNMILI